MSTLTRAHEIADLVDRMVKTLGDLAGGEAKGAVPPSIRDTMLEFREACREEAVREYMAYERHINDEEDD